MLVHIDTKSLLELNISWLYLPIVVSENQEDDIFTDDIPRSVFSVQQNSHQRTRPYNVKQSTAVK